MPLDGASVATSAASPVAVRAQIDRVLASATFSTAPKLRRFLAYLGEAMLSGSADSPKEFMIGEAVFDRGEGFDPRNDTIVRVQARRLRAKLEDYYRAEGKDDREEIRLPRGRYRLELVPRTLAIPDSPALAAEEAVSLPAPRTRLIGRARELEQLCRMLRDRTRLITLTGAGGSGKTRVAIAVGRLLTDAFPGGISFASMEHVIDPALANAILAKFRRTSADEPDQEIPPVLTRGREPARLLILDNFEQLLAAAPEVGRLLDAAESLQIMVTSRFSLGLYGEREYSIKAFSAPDTDEHTPFAEIQRNFGVELFCERARSLDPAFELTADNALAVARICAQVDGLPLAIELAAARIRILSAPQILERLTASLYSAPVGTCDLPERHQTLRPGCAGELWTAFCPRTTALHAPCGFCRGLHA